MSDEQNKYDAMFNQIAGAEAVGETVGAVHTIYAEAQKRGFPEERAWQLSLHMVDKLWAAAEPLIQKFIRESM